MSSTRALPGLTALALTGLLAGCSVSTTGTDPLASPSASSSSSSSSSSDAASPTATPVLDLQLRPVRSAERADPDACPTLPATTPPGGSSATLCSNDGRASYDLDPAVVTGDRVTSIEALYSATGPVVQIKLDAMGGTALRTTTLRGSLQDPQPQLAIVTHGGVLGAPTMTEELDGGVLLVSGFESFEKAEEVVRYIQASGS